MDYVNDEKLRKSVRNIVSIPVGEAYITDLINKAVVACHDYLTESTSDEAARVMITSFVSAQIPPKKTTSALSRHKP